MEISRNDQIMIETVALNLGEIASALTTLMRCREDGNLGDARLFWELSRHKVSLCRWKTKLENIVDVSKDGRP